MNDSLCVIGCGDVFDYLAAARKRIDPARAWHMVGLEGTDEIQQGAEQRLSRFDPSTLRVFVAVDAGAMNHARLELYGKLRLLGFVSDTLIDPDARVDPSATLGENCWVGPGAHVGPGCRIASNVFIGAGARLDGDAHIGMSTWIGAGCSLGRGATTGPHCVLGDDIRVARDVAIGRHCVIEQPGFYRESIADGTFMHSAFPSVVRVCSPPAATRRTTRRET